MKEILGSILSASLSGSVIILLVLGLRLVLKKAPRRYICLLWLLAGVRLLIPFHIESSLSLQPDITPIVSQIQAETPAVQDPVIQDPAAQAPVTQNPAPQEPAADAPQVQNPPVNTPQLTPEPDGAAQPTPAVDLEALVPWVWAAVACGFLGYTLISYAVLRRRVRDAVQVDEGIFECAGIESPFLLGYIRPNIYLPSGIPLSDLDYILAHERAHIERGDNWVKLMGFLCVAVHWFNPLVWVAYVMLCKDIEMACDEYVVKYMDNADRKAYSNALLNCAAQHRSISACPVAFGEVSVKQRILTVLNYRKPGFWISLVAIIAIVFVAVCFLTNPITADKHNMPSFTTPTSDMPAPDENAALIAECKAALEAWQNMESYEMTASLESTGELVLTESVQTQFYKHGNDQLKILYYPDWSEGHTIYSMTADGTVFTRQKGNNAGDGRPYDHGWSESDEPFYPLWFMYFNWDNYTILVEDYQGALGEYMIELLAISSDETLAPEERNMTLQFCFDRDGSLDTLVRQATYVVTYDEELYAEQLTQTFQLLPTEETEIAAVIGSHYLEATGRGTVSHITETQMLDHCRQALAHLQASEHYYLGEYVTASPDVMLGYNEAQYLRCGNDWYRMSSASDSTMEYLQKDRQQFAKYTTAAIPEEDNPYPIWTETDLTDVMLDDDLWLLDFAWDPGQIVFQGNSSTAGIERISITVTDENFAFGSYVLTFQFKDDYRELTSVTKTITTEDPSGKPEMFTSTVYIVSTDEAEVTATIESHYLEARLASSNDEANGAMSD